MAYFAGALAFHKKKEIIPQLPRRCSAQDIVPCQEAKEMGVRILVCTNHIGRYPQYLACGREAGFEDNEIVVAATDSRALSIVRDRDNDIVLAIVDSHFSHGQDRHGGIGMILALRQL